MSAKPENLAAVIEKPKARLKTIVRPIPSAGEGEIVVHNHAIAANPVDWKIQDFGIIINKYPAVLGSDVCGIVTEIGPEVTKFEVGDRVAGFAGVIYNKDPDHGAWQTYTILLEVATMSVPGSLSFAEGREFSNGFRHNGCCLLRQAWTSSPRQCVKSIRAWLPGLRRLLVCQNGRHSTSQEHGVQGLYNCEPETSRMLNVTRGLRGC